MSSQRRGGWIVVLSLFSISLVPGPGPAADAGRPKRPTARADAAPAIKVAHVEEEDGWQVARTTNFCLFHRNSPALAEAVLRTAERTRTVQQRKWFGAIAEDWSPRCAMCLYPSAESYSESTGAPANLGGGHTDVRVEEGRVLSRYIHIHGPRELLLEGVVPHEVTHAVLAGRMGGARVPRWADEGMAVLAEPKSRVELHLHSLSRCRDDQLLFSVSDLVQMRDYPQSRAIGAFYAQSVSLVDFLARAKGSTRFTAFVRDGERDGYAASLRRHYGWSFAELDRRWQRHAFPDESSATMASGGGG
jgi:hypothetical protein